MTSESSRPALTSVAPAPGAGRSEPTAAQRRSARIQIVLMLVIFAAPVAMSYIWYFLVHPANGHIYGTLLEVAPVTAAAVLDDEGQPASLDALKGKWVLIAQDEGACAAGCRDKLYGMRQVRAALGHDDTRVERVLLLDDRAPLPADIKAAYQGTRFLRVAGTPLAAALTAAAGAPHEHLWVIDPLGNLVLRYPANPDLKRVLKDMERLLKASQIG